MLGAKKSAWTLVVVIGGLTAGCFPDLTPERGSLTVGLLGVDVGTDTVRVTVTAGAERLVVEEALTPAASVRVEVVPVGPIGVLAETLRQGTLLQSKGINTDVQMGENEVGIDFGSAGPNPPDEVRSAPQLVVVRLEGEDIVGGRLQAAERIERDPFLAFLAAARASLGGAVQVIGVVEATASSGDETFDDIFDGPFDLEIAPEGSGGIVVGSFPASGAQSELASNDADLAALATSFDAGRFNVRLDGPTSESQVDVDVSVQIVFAATRR